MSHAADIDADLNLPPGAVVGGKYEIVRVLGRGGMGVVVEARHLRMKRDVALKVLLPSLRAQPEIVARFEREGRSAAQLTSPHVARVLDVDTLVDGTPFIVMELLRGKDLNDLLTERGPLPYREAVGYLIEACEGMVDAHRAGIVHRDLKPNNIFLDEQSGRRVVKVLDFGISKVLGDENQSMTATATAFGTPLYMSPEQVRSTKNVDARADIWSLGVVLYELLTGATPFTAPSAPAIIAAIIADRPVPLAERRPDLPTELARVVMHALAKDPNERFQNVQSFAAALGPFGPKGDAFTMPPALVLHDVAPTVASTNLPLQLGSEPPRRRSSMIPIALGMGLAFVAGGGLLIAALRRPPPVTTHAAEEVKPTATVMAGPSILPASAAAPTATASAIAPPEAPTAASAAVKPPPPRPSGKPISTAAPRATSTPGPIKPPPPPDDPRYL